MRAFVVLSIAMSLCGPSAWAAGKVQARPTEEKLAKKACATEDYRKGIDILADLYVETNDPVYVFNQGRCYEQNGRFDQAIERFREYLRKTPEMSVSERADVEKHIADCQNLMPKTAAPVAPAAMPPPVPAPAPAPEPAPIQSPPPSSSEAGSRLRTAGLVTAGVGTAALIAAVVLNVEHESLVTQQNKPGNYSTSREDSIKAYETWGWVGYGVGAAALVAGGVMYVLGLQSASGSQKTMSLLPALDRNGVGCVLQGAF